LLGCKLREEEAREKEGGLGEREGKRKKKERKKKKKKKKSAFLHVFGCEKRVTIKGLRSSKNVKNAD